MITTFVGREKELQQMMDLYNTIVKRLPHKANLFFVEGEAGAGKSTLTNKFIELLKTDQSPRVIIGHVSCEIFAKGISFLPFFQLLDDIRNQQGALSRITNLERFNQIIGDVAPSWLKMLPFVGDAISETVGAIRDIQKDAYKQNSFAPSQQMDMDIYGQFLRLLVKFEESNPILLIIDDLQWADEETLRLFSYLARRLPEKNNRIMLVGAYRADDLARENQILYDIVLDLEKRGQAKIIRLPSFTIEDITNLFVQLYGISTSEIPLGFEKKLIIHTAGNPLFINELLKHFEEENKIEFVNNRWIFSDSESLSDNLPESLEAALEQRIIRLEKKLREILTIASVEGESFTAEVLSKIKNLELAEVLNSLVGDLSKNHRLVRESGEIEIALRNFVSLYQFRHGLIRDYIYKSLSPVQKRLMHQQVGDCLESLYGDKAYLISHQLANHFLIAKDYSKLAHYGLVVARQEFERFAPKQSLWWAKTTIDAAKHIGGNPEVLCEALLVTIQSHIHLAQNDDALLEIENLQSVSGISEIQFGLSEYLKGEVLTRKGLFESANLALETALDVFKKKAECQFSGWALRRLGHIKAIMGNFADAEKYWLEGLDVLDKLQDPVSIEVKGILWSEIAEFSVDAGDLGKAELANRNALEFFHQIKSKKGEAICLRNLGGIEFMYGNIAKSEALTRRAVEIFKEVEDGVNIIWSSDNLSRSLIERGSIEEAKKILLDIEPMAIEMNEVGFLPEIYIHLSEIARLERRSADAMLYAKNATEIVATDDQYSGPRSFSALAKAFLDVGERVHAENNMQIALRMIENTNYIYVKAIVIFDYAQFLLRTESKTDKIIQLCLQAKDIFSGIGSQWDLDKVILFEKSVDINDAF